MSRSSDDAFRSPTRRNTTREEHGVTRLALVVEARPDLRGLLSDYLVSRGIVPMPAAGSAHAEIICEMLAPHLVFIDAPLDDVATTNFIRRMCARHPSAPIVMCIPPDTDREARYRAEGVCEILRTPFDLVEVDAAIDRVMAVTRAA